MKRGEIYWAHLAPRSGSEQRGRRPVVVVSNDGFNEIETWRSVIVVPLTTSTSQGRRGPTTVSLATTRTGLSQSSFAICHQITTLDRAKLHHHIGTLSRDEMASLEAGIAAACDLKL